MTFRPAHPELPGASDTIAAIATASGQGALALVRMSGPGTRDIARTILEPPPRDARRATHCRVVLNGEAVDDVVATLFHAPASFTGEDLLEIATHGGLVSPAAVLACVIRAGARLATPGEFTRRAVLNGKLDLVQAEAIGDLVSARSMSAQRMALRQLDGGLSTRISELRQELLALEGLLAYDIDFPEEDDGPVSRERVDEAATRIDATLHALLATAPKAARVRDGALVVLVGAPNAGKSSLFNALLGEARAIVTDVPGTTRDAIEAVLDLPRWPLRLVDTAGLRETHEQVERLGIATTTRYAEQAALVLFCADSREEDAVIPDALRARAEDVLIVHTKSDLVTKRYQSGVMVSAVTGEGVQQLLSAIEHRLEHSHGVANEDIPALTRERHETAVRIASDEVGQFLEAWRQRTLPAVVAATHVRAGVNALEELIGSVSVDDVLDVVFRSFCVGK